MLRIALLVSLVGVAVPAIAQSRVYTNADVSSGTVTWTQAPPPEDAVRILAASHSIVNRTDAGRFAINPYGPEVVFLPHDRHWPFDGPPVLSAPSIADSWWRDPVSAYALQHPIEAAYGVSWRGGVRVHPPARVVRPAAPVMATPVVHQSGMPAGRASRR